MNAIIEKINSIGCVFIEFTLPMLIQASILIVLLLLADFVLRKRVCSVFRYWILMLVLVKLVLPTSLSGPFSVGYWFGDKLEYADVGRGAYEPQAAGPTMPALPYIDTSNVPPAIYPPATYPAAGEVDVSAAHPIAAPGAPPVQIHWQGVVFLLWLAIVVALLLLLGQRAIFVHSLVAQAKEANRAMCDALDDCRKRMKVRGKPSLKISPNATSPAVCGLFRPVILVPNNLSTALGAEDLEVVLLHELAHIKRGDLWVNLAQTFLQIVYFYNPLLWLANAVIRKAREQAVDEAVLVAMGEKASRYPQTLVSVAKLAFKRPALSLRLIGVVESKSALTARIKRILSRPIPKSAKLGVVGLLAIIVTAAILLPMAKGEWEKDIRNPVSLDENGKPIVTHTLYMQGQPEEPVYRLEGKTYSDVEHVVAHIGELMKQKPFPYIRVYTTSQFQRQQQPIEQLGKLCREIGFINMEFKYDLECSNGELKATLPNGVTVELVGVCEHPSEGKQWWGVDGQAIARPYERLNRNERSGDSELYEVVYRLFGCDDILSTIYSSSEITGHISVNPLSQKTEKLNIPDAANAYGAILLVKPDAQSIRLEIGAGRDSDWKTLCSQSSPVDKTGTTGPGVVFQPAIEKDGKTHITIAHQIKDRQIRVIVIDHSGQIHKSEGFQNTISGELGSCQVRFDLPAEKIKEIQFQTQKFQRATFKNVSLRHGVKTDVEVLISDKGFTNKESASVSGS